MENIQNHINHLVNWIKTYFVENGPTCNAIIGISGGKDSSIAAALCVRALGADRVIGVKMPQGKQSDIEDANEIIKTLGIRSVEINIEDICNAEYDSLQKAGIEITEQIRINTPARIRMTTLYAVAAANHGRVCNTCNLSEDYIGYSTKFGDNAGDFAPLKNYTVHDLLLIGYGLNEIPLKLIQKTPTDGLCGKTDEETFGFSYEILDNFILNKTIPDDYNIYNKIISMNKHNAHKLRLIESCPKFYETKFIFRK